MHVDAKRMVACQASDEIAAICRHLDLQCEVLPAPPGSSASKRITVTRGENAFGEAEAAEAEAATVAPRPAMVSGKERLAQRYGKKPPKAAVEAWQGVQSAVRVGRILAAKAENLLEKSELPKLADFYRALVDAYPGFHVPLAKLLTQNLRAAGEKKRKKLWLNCGKILHSGGRGKSTKMHLRKKKKKEKKEKKKEKKEKKAKDL
eukprot:Skav207847  [mRNA]  locus=scaffold3025:265740:267129:- [translate_table: standard]